VYVTLESACVDAIGGTKHLYCYFEIFLMVGVDFFCKFFGSLHFVLWLFYSEVLFVLLWWCLILVVCLDIYGLDLLGSLWYISASGEYPIWWSFWNDLMWAGTASTWAWSGDDGSISRIFLGRYLRDLLPHMWNSMTVAMRSIKMFLKFFYELRERTPYYHSQGPMAMDFTPL
jgi:hypothetical protein